jgi:hypothetical protein
MNTDKVLNLLPGIIAIGGVTYLASTHFAARYIIDGAMVVSYGAVVALLVMAAFDNRGNAKGYAKR